MTATVQQELPVNMVVAQQLYTETVLITIQQTVQHNVKTQTVQLQERHLILGNIAVQQSAAIVRKHEVLLTQIHLQQHHLYVKNVLIVELLLIVLTITHCITAIDGATIVVMTEEAVIHIDILGHRTVHVSTMDIADSAVLQQTRPLLNMK